MDLETISSESLNKEVAYLLGVYLTDGSISYTESYTFSLKVIDRDFVENTLNAFKKLNPACTANVYTQEPRERHWPDGRISKTQLQYCINVGFSKFEEWFKNQTGNKHHIPTIIWNAPLQIKKWFVAGVMDGDGWISKTERKDYPRTYQYRVGVGGTEDGWIYEFKELLEKIGVKTLKNDRDGIGGVRMRKVPFVAFGVKVETFVGCGLGFGMKRKQDRLLAYIKERSET